MEKQNLNTRKLTIEKTKESSLLSDFSCGIESIDDFIHSELQSYVDMGNCQLFLVRENSIINIFMALIFCFFIRCREIVIYNIYLCINELLNS